MKSVVVGSAPKVMKIMDKLDFHVINKKYANLVGEWSYFTYKLRDNYRYSNTIKIRQLFGVIVIIGKIILHHKTL